MSNISKNTEQKYLLDGLPFNAPIDWEDITIEANYENDSIQPSLAVENFQFTLEAREKIIQWVNDGLTGGVGIFEGMPFQLTLFNNTAIQENFKAYIDFTNDFKNLIEDGKIDVSIIKKDGLDNFFAQISGTTFGYLESVGAVGSSDYTTVDYVVEKKFNLFEILVTSIVLYLMIKELRESIERTTKAILTVTALFNASVFPSVGSIIYAIGVAIINIAYTAILLLAIIDLAQTLINTLVPPKRQHKAIKLKRALEVVCAHFGYNLIAPASEFNDLYYLPSNPRLDDKTIFGFISNAKGVPKGIPNTLDYGYNCEEMFTIAKNLINGKMTIDGNNVHLRPKNDPYWIQQATWNLPSVLIQKIEYNTDDLKPARLLSFETDLNDEWTIDNYSFNGTAFEIRTEPITVIRKNAVLLKGLEEVKFFTALPSRKDSLNAIENLLKVVASFIDGVTGVLGGGTNFASQIQSKVGMLKQSENYHSIPKLLYLQGGKLPINYNTVFNSGLMYTKYHKEESFVLDNYRNQKKLYKDVEIPFGFTDYQQLTQNSYFTFKNKQAKIIKFVWKVGTDTATIDFWVREPYTYNLKERYIQP